jgi:NAD(P)-dependent dehydrogenase (short-subunit alcohol dehydrogenase family)
MWVIDILVNNIGSTFPDDRDTNTERESMFHYHLMGTVSSTQLFQQQLWNQKWCIINISSVSGIEPLLRYKWARLEAYCCMKAAVNMYTKIIANQCAGTIRVNSIAPGNTDTESWKWSDEWFKELRRKWTLIGRFIKPSEIGKMAYQIIENEALNWQVFIVDGWVVGKWYE